MKKLLFMPILLAGLQVALVASEQKGTDVASLEEVTQQNPYQVAGKIAFMYFLTRECFVSFGLGCSDILATVTNVNTGRSKFDMLSNAAGFIAMLAFHKTLDEHIVEESQKTKSTRIQFLNRVAKVGPFVELIGAPMAAGFCDGLVASRNEYLGR